MFGLLNINQFHKEVNYLTTMERRMYNANDYVNGMEYRRERIRLIEQAMFHNVIPVTEGKKLLDITV